MLQRGRKSSEGLSVVRVAPQRVAPPDRLGGDESTIWREIVASKPADWFGPTPPHHLEASILTSSDYDLAAGVAKKLYFLGELCR